MSQALLHDAAALLTTQIVSLFRPLLREEEQATAWQEVYGAVKAGFETFAVRLGREFRRLHPLDSPN